jgi:hypothetical protein
MKPAIIDYLMNLSSEIYAYPFQSIDEDQLWNHICKISQPVIPTGTGALMMSETDTI